MGRRVFVVGVGLIPFTKPGSRDWNYPTMGATATRLALEDAGVPYEAIEQVAVGYVYGDTAAGQRAVYEVGMTGIPVVNVNNACATGSSALFLTRQMVAAGAIDCGLALGFEKMERGSLTNKFPAHTAPMDRHFAAMRTRHTFDRGAPAAAQIFGNAGREYIERYSPPADVFARVAEKNHRHSVNNPYAQFQIQYSLEEILASPTVHAPLTKLQCCPTSDGGGAAVLASESFVEQHDLWTRAVEITAMTMVTDLTDTFAATGMELVGTSMARSAADSVYAQSGRGPEDLDVIELHDCFSTNELITYEALRLCGEGVAPELISSGAVTYGGDVVVNPSGGLISKGHPLGATGLAQCAELTWQMRGEAGPRQVPGARTALQHNLGLGGACVVTMYERVPAPS